MGRRKSFPSRTPKKNKISLARREAWKKRRSSVVENVEIQTSQDYFEKEKTIISSDDDASSSKRVTVLEDLTNKPTTSNSPNVCDTISEFAFIDEEEYHSIANAPLCVETARPEDDEYLNGHRIVDLKYVLKWALKLQVDHSKKCTLGELKVVNEKRIGLGLASQIVFQCTMCNEEIIKSTEKLNNTQNMPLKLNLGAVWGTISTGGTYSHMSEFLACLDVPAMPYRMFHSIEIMLGNKWKDELWQTIEKAGEEELNLAKAKGQVDKDGTIWTTVYADGGWSQRSYGHSYNAASGVGVIIGQLSSKILFIGIRNKYCSVCARADNKNERPKEHVCFKNWTKSSSSMETDIIVEGFSCSVEMHNLKYKRLIADGDSSVYSNILSKVEYGTQVEKIECKNHAIKNYGKTLYKLQKDTKINIHGRKLLTVTKIKELQNISKRIIYENANMSSENLKVELEKGPHHVFDDHSHCSESYCKNLGQISKSLIPTLQSTGIYHHIRSALDRLIIMAGALQSNETNNKAEMFMSLLCKYTAGKRLNLIQRGSYETRAYVAALRYNLGVAWEQSVWENIVSETPGDNFKKFFEQMERNNESHKRKRTDGTPKYRKKLQTKTKDSDYGSSVPTTMLEKDYKSEEIRILKSLQVTKEHILEIEKDTVGQWTNSQYRSERKDRLTASLFGEVAKRRKTTPCHALVKKILYETNFTSEAMQYGKNQELVALQRFCRQKPQAKVRQCGLFVDETYGYLAASPDALLGENALIEIKCLYSVHKAQKSLQEAVQENKNMCLEIKDGKIRLKRNHNYYYQVQGQLNICQKNMCFFIVYVNDDEPLHIEVILRNQEFWKETLGKLKEFYINCVLPEIIYRNIPKGLKARDPQD